MNLRKQAIVALAMGALTLPVMSTAVVTLSAAPAFAKGPNGHGNSGNHGKPSKTHGNGSVRSELKGANASHANVNALEHASDNSRVGKVRIYRDAALVTAAAETEAAGAQVRLEEYMAGDPGYSTAEVQAAIDLLDPGSEIYAEELAAYEAMLRAAADYEAGLVTLQDEADRLAAEAEAAAAAEGDALLVLTDGRTLSDAAMDELRGNLGL